MVKKWEYKIEKVYPGMDSIFGPGLNEMWLNTQGENGWELVSVLIRDDGGLIFIFKREKE